MHAGRGRQVPGDKRDNIMHDERYLAHGQLSGGDRLCGGDVHLIRWAGLVLELPCIQHVCSRRDELLL